MAAISGITDGEILSSVRTKLNNVITEINLLDPTDWIDYSSTSTVVGWSVLTTKKIRYRVIGKQIFVVVQLVGTSNSTTTTFTLPFTRGSNIYTLNYAWAINGGAFVNGAIELTSSSSTVVCSYTGGQTSWTASGSKQIYGQFFYEIA
jgi:hypothetical protein